MDRGKQGTSVEQKDESEKHSENPGEKYKDLNYGNSRGDGGKDRDKNSSSLRKNSNRLDLTQVIQEESQFPIWVPG